jgi:hypothetical protein
MTPTHLPSLSPEGAFAADRQSRTHAKPLVGPFHAGGFARDGDGEPT